MKVPLPPHPRCHTLHIPCDPFVLSLDTVLASSDQLVVFDDQGHNLVEAAVVAWAGVNTSVSAFREKVVQLRALKFTIGGSGSWQYRAAMESIKSSFPNSAWRTSKLYEQFQTIAQL